MQAQTAFIDRSATDVGVVVTSPPVLSPSILWRAFNNRRADPAHTRIAGYRMTQEIAFTITLLPATAVLLGSLTHSVWFTFLLTVAAWSAATAARVLAAPLLRLHSVRELDEWCRRCGEESQRRMTEERMAGKAVPEPTSTVWPRHTLTDMRLRGGLYAHLAEWLHSDDAEHGRRGIRLRARAIALGNASNLSMLDRRGPREFCVIDSQTATSVVFPPELEEFDDDTLVHLAALARRRHIAQTRLDTILAAHSRAIDAGADRMAPEIGQAREDISRLTDEVDGLRFEFDNLVDETRDAIRTRHRLANLNRTKYAEADALHTLADQSERLRRDRG